MSVRTAYELNLMRGFPPDDDKIVTLGNWQDPPYHRWAFQHVSQIIPTEQIGRGAGPVRGFPALPHELTSLRIEGFGQRMTLLEVLEQTYTDAFVVVKDGAIITEQYWNQMTRDTKHLLMSVSKSVTGMLVGVLVETGALQRADQVSQYVPELRNSAYGDATVKQVLDMTVSLVFREDYDDPTSEIQQQDRAIGWRVAKPGDAPSNYHFLPTLQKRAEHGTTFQYCSANTDVLGWIVERVSGVPFAELLGREIWSKLGAEHDAYITVDRYGGAIANGGICVTARDLARFGQMILQQGRVDGQAVVPPGWIRETRDGGDNRPWSRDQQWSALYPRGNYHSQWYNTEDPHRCFYGSGIHGQHLWIDPTVNMVIVKLSSRPSATDEVMTAQTLAAFTAIGQALR